MKCLSKVSALNDFYSTNIDKIKGGAYKMALHITKLNENNYLDKWINMDSADNKECILHKEQIKIVGEIANLDSTHAKNSQSKILKSKQYYSFASKYCAIHNENYPIYDSFVAKMLKYFGKVDKSFCNFYADELKDYKRFYEIICQLRQHYKLEKYTLSQIDTIFG